MLKMRPSGRRGAPVPQDARASTDALPDTRRCRVQWQISLNQPWGRFAEGATTYWGPGLRFADRYRLDWSAVRDYSQGRDLA
jgi:hypothetical protein